MNTLARVNMTFRAMLQEKEKCAGGCPSHSGQQVLCDQGRSQNSILWPNTQPTWKADGRTRKERSRRRTSSVLLPKHTTLAGWFASAEGPPALPWP